jgi:hypothetical protein
MACKGSAVRSRLAPPVIQGLVYQPLSFEPGRTAATGREHNEILSDGTPDCSRCCRLLMSPSSSRPRTPPFHGGNRGSNPLGDATHARNVAEPGAGRYRQ